MLQELKTKSEFARMCKIDKQSVGYACVHIISAAIVDNKVNIYHPSAVEYMNITPEQRNRGYRASERLMGYKDHVKQQQKDYENKKKNGDTFDAILEDDEPGGDEDYDEQQPIEQKKQVRKKNTTYNILSDGKPLPEHIQQYIDAPFSQVIELFGDDASMIYWLKGAKLLQDITTSQIKNDTSKGKLITREMVKIGFIEPVDEMCTRLVSDAARTISSSILALGASGGSPKDAEDVFSKGIASYIKSLKQNIKKTLSELDNVS